MLAFAFATYIALGDSISINYYPAADVERRHRGKASTTKLGAVSLLHRNDDKLWPEFRGRDLASRFPKVQVLDLTADGATTRSLLLQVERVPRGGDSTLITITAGGNDLLGEIGGRNSPVDAIFERLRAGVQRVLTLRPNSVVLLGTVYDPSDGTNRLPGSSAALDREAVWLREYNDAIRKFVATDERLRLADIQAHFFGRGMKVAPAERWYLEESIIEPNARGASEVRRVWLEALEP